MSTEFTECWFCKNRLEGSHTLLRAVYEYSLHFEDTLFDLCYSVLSVSEFHENRHERVRIFLTTKMQLISRVYRETKWHFENLYRHASASVLRHSVHDLM